MHWLKKATNPLDPRLRAGGYEVLPVVKLFAKHWNYNPAGLIQEHLLNDSLVAWAINTLSLVRCLREPELERDNPRILYDSVTSGVFNEKNDKAARIRNTMVRPDHFIQRLTQAEAQKIIARVIRNAERVNSEDRDFYFDWIGIFGSVLRGSETPADVDIVFSARWAWGDPLPESSYYPFSRNEPTDLAARALRTGCRRSAVSPHYHLEVKTVGMPYKVIWMMDKGLVTRKITVPKAKKFQEDDTKRELSQSNAFADDFRARCVALPPFPPPEKPSIPPGTQPLTRSKWVKILESGHPVTDLAHALCLPPGDLKAKVAELMEERFAKKPKEKTLAEKILYPYLAASALYATQWKWDPAVGLRKTKTR